MMHRIVCYIYSEKTLLLGVVAFKHLLGFVLYQPVDQQHRVQFGVAIVRWQLVGSFSKVELAILCCRSLAPVWREC